MLVGLWFPGRRAIFILALVASLLTIAGYLLSAPAVADWMVLTNRALAFLAIWVTAILGSQRKERDGWLARSGDETRQDAECRPSADAFHERDMILRAVIDNLPSLIYVRDAQGRYTLTNREFERRHGLAPGEGVGKTPYDLLPADVADDRIATDRAVMETGEVLERELDVIYSDGTTRTMLSSKFPVEGADGEIVGVGVVGTDLTERKRADRSNALLATFLEHLSDAVEVTDSEGRIEYVNPAHEELTGYAASEVLGSTPADLHRPKDHDPAFYDAIWETISHGQTWNGELPAVRKDGTSWQADATISPVHDEIGAITHFVAIKRDITERKLAEEVVRRAKEEAETASRAKSEFLSSMSHELRTPLNAILGFGQLLELSPKEPLSETQRDYVRAILTGGEHLLQLISEVLDLSMIESGRIDLLWDNVETAGVVEESVSVARIMAEKKGVAVVVRSAGEDLAPVRADRTRLKQVLLNLLSNTVKYNRDGGTVNVDCRQTTDGMLRIGVADTGQGIPAERQGELFAPFSRLGAEASSVEGTGIGLTLCKRLVEMMGGSIGFESRVGEGSTFWFELPLAAEPAPAKDGLAIAKPVLGAGSQPSRQRTMLYVEDNPANLYLMEAIIERVPDMTLDSAHNGELALDLAEVHRPAVIVMDINLPGMDGFEALRRLRRAEATRGIPVIALSAAAMPQDIENGIEAGFHDYLTKPIKVDEVLAALHDALKSSETDPPPGEARPQAR